MFWSLWFPIRWKLYEVQFELRMKTWQCRLCCRRVSYSAASKNFEVKIFYIYFNHSRPSETSIKLVASWIKRIFLDEASQALLPSVIHPLLCANKFILVGDPAQLPPVVQVGWLEADRLPLEEGRPHSYPVFSLGSSIKEGVSQINKLLEQAWKCNVPPF